MKKLIFSFSFLFSINIFALNFDSLKTQYPHKIDSLGRITKGVYSKLKKTGLKRTTVHEHFHLTHGNKILNFLIEGPEIWKEYEKFISEAKHEINIVSFVWFFKIPWVQMEGVKGPPRINDGVKSIGRGLIKAQENIREGDKINLRIMVSLNPHLKALRQNHIKEVLKSFNFWIKEGVDGKKLNFKKFDIEIVDFFHRLKGSIHDKYLVVDGKKAILTGANVENNNNFDPRRWHDTGLSFEGPSIIGLLSSFKKSWERKKNKHYKIVIKKQNYKLKKLKRNKPYISSFPKANIPRPSKGGITFLALPQEANDRQNNDVISPQSLGWKHSMELAKKWIYVETPNINDDQFLKSIIKAAGKGVLVNVLTGHKFNKSSHGQLLGFVLGLGGHNEKVIKKRVKKIAKKIYGKDFPKFFPTLKKNLQFKWYSSDGKAPADGNGQGASHTKLLTVDGEITIQGSGNQDTFSWNFCNEFNFLIDDKNHTKNMESFFLNDWKRSFDVSWY